MDTSQRFTLLNHLLERANGFSRVAIWVAGALTLISALYITADVLMRKITGFALGGSDELSGYAFAISISWALSFATLQRANIRIDALYQHLPTRLCAALDWLALVALAVFIAYLTLYAYDVTMTSWVKNSRSNSTLGTPLWIPQIIWLAGFIWFCIVLALMLIRATLALLTGDMASIRSLTGMRSIEEEAEDEAEQGRRFAEGDHP